MHLSARLMAVMARLNGRFRRGTVRPLATGIARGWSARQSRVSPRVMAQGSAMLEAHAWQRTDCFKKEADHSSNPSVP
ncbi:MAG: DUF4113 domain-containing protein [Proteobacteria bacterium]|nr:MAG: DUF4113 domain-containing protein [Pseudomonadota bacterium]